MTSRTNMLYLVIAVGALASAGLQPSEATALEQSAVRLGAAFWSDEAVVPASDAASPDGASGLR